MQRVMIIGAPGSGKSTLARAMAKRTGLPVLHIDHIHYRSGWEERDVEEKRLLVQKVHQTDRWIIEGGISSTWQERLARADSLIWLDRTFVIRMRRVLARSWKYHGQARPDLPDGCIEQFNAQTFDFLLYVWRTRKRSKKKMHALFSNSRPELTRYRLISDKAVAEFLETLKA